MTTATTTTIVDLACPHCGRRQEHMTGLTGERPRTKDIAVCLDCGGLQIFIDDGVRVPDAKEIATMMAEPRVRLTVGAVLFRLRVESAKRGTP